MRTRAVGGRKITYNVTVVTKRLNVFVLLLFCLFVCLLFLLGVVLSFDLIGREKSLSVT